MAGAPPRSGTVMLADELQHCPTCQCDLRKEVLDRLEAAKKRVQRGDALLRALDLWHLSGDSRTWNVVNRYLHGLLLTHQQPSSKVHKLTKQERLDVLRNLAIKATEV